MRTTASGLPSYAVVTPVRDEAMHLGRTAEAVVAQTHRPQQWVIVDDGSTDETRAIAESYAAGHDWIEVVSSEREHRRARGAPIVRAFEQGRRRLQRRPDVTVKFDGDLFIPSHYFEWVARVFDRDHRAGIVGGVALVHDGTRWRLDGVDTTHVNGVAKAYRTDCLEDMGGLQPSMGWDGIDEYSARSRGWHVHVLNELTILHYNRRGSKQRWYRSRWEEGRGNHYMGYRWDYLAARVVYRMAVEDPPVAGGLVLGAGYAWAALRGRPQVEDAGAVGLLRQEQHDRLVGFVRRRIDPAPPPLPGGGPAFWAGAPPDRG